MDVCNLISHHMVASLHYSSSHVEYSGLKMEAPDVMFFVFFKSKEGADLQGPGRDSQATLQLKRVSRLWNLTI